MIVYRRDYIKLHNHYNTADAWEAEIQVAT